MAFDAYYVFATIQLVRCQDAKPGDIIGIVQYDDDYTCVNEQEIVDDPTRTEDVFIQLPIAAICPPTSSARAINEGPGTTPTAKTYRVASVIYRNQKLFGTEDPNSHDENPDSCTRQQWPETNYVTTMDVVPADSITGGEVPMERFKLFEPLTFGATVKNYSNQVRYFVLSAATESTVSYVEHLRYT